MKRILLMGLLASILTFFGCEKQEEKTPTSGVTVTQVINVGKEAIVDSISPSAQFAVVFEDDGESGYFYGLDTSRKNNLILDALHIYNVANVTDKDIPSTVQIVWSADGLKSALLINKYPHAIFDFQARRGYCRTGFPPIKTWSQEGHEWDDKAYELFK